MTAVAEAKRAGQDASLTAVSPQKLAAFLDHIDALPAGIDVSVNTLRTWLDTLGVPARARGGLFRAAVAEGLIVPLVISNGTYTVPVRVKSTGPSAHHAYVQVYRRVDSS